MELGIIGLGKMGFNMAERLRLAGHKVVGFDFNKDATAKLTAAGSLGVNSLEDLVKNLAAPRARSGSWLPSGDPVDQTIAKLEPLMEKGDTFIDGGNSNYKDTQRRHAEVTNKGFQFRRLRNLRRRVGAERGLQPDDRRRQRAGRAAAADLRGAGARARRGLGTCRARRARDTSSRWCTTASSTA